MVDNYHPIWTWMGQRDVWARDNNKDPKKDKYVDAAGKEIECPKPCYTESDTGVPKFGGWNRQGKRVFYKIQLAITKMEADDDQHEAALLIDQEALRRMREIHEVAEKEAKRKQRGKKNRWFLQPADDESEIEEDDGLDEMD